MNKEVEGGEEGKPRVGGKGQEASLDKVTHLHAMRFCTRQ